jgi:hypothetical protein
MNLVERAKRLLLTPQPEWEVINAETTTTAALYSQYIVPLAAIGPVARVIGWVLSGVTYGPSIGRAVVGAVVSYVLALVGVYLLAIIIDMLAPTFGGTSNRMQALKVAAYSSTAAWVAGIFWILPALSILGIVGLYSIYLLYLGLPVLMKASAEKAGAYTVVVVLVGIVIFMVIGTVGTRVMLGGFM